MGRKGLVILTKTKDAKRLLLQKSKNKRGHKENEIVRKALAKMRGKKRVSGKKKENKLNTKKKGTALRTKPKKKRKSTNIKTTSKKTNKRKGTNTGSSFYLRK